MGSHLSGPVALSLFLAGCSLPRETIEGSDSSTFFAGARASWEMSSSEPVEGDRSGSWTLLEMDVSGAGSSFSQRVRGGSAIEIGDQLFVGPTTVDVDFDLLRVAAELRHGKRAASGLGFEVLVGLTYSELDLSGTAGSRRASESEGGVGPLVGLGLFYEPEDRLRLFVEGSVNPVLTGSVLDGVGIRTIEFGVRFQVQEHVALSAGWRRYTYKAENDVFSSDLDLEASGPALTLCVSW